MQSTSIDKYHYVTQKEAEANPVYWELVKNNFKENLLKETTDDKKIELHIECIHKGDLTQLDFSDPEFVRNIYKALRLNKIDLNQLVDAILLYYAAHVEFAEEKSPSTIHRFTFEEKGPYDHKEIDYASMKEFKDNIQKIPENQQCYYTINFSKKCEIAFLYLQLKILENETRTPREKIVTILNIYFDTNYTVDSFKSPGKCKAIAKQLIDKLIKQEPAHHSFISEIIQGKNLKEDPVLGSITLLTGFIEVNERMPNIQISPDYNREDPSSSLLCMIYPTVVSFITLNRTAHGKDAISPIFTVGNFDNTALKAAVKKNMRLIEIPHPDLLKKNEIVHNVSVYPFTLSWHDFLHLWQNSANTEKPLIHFIHELFENQTKRKMSKPIFACIDMDFSGYLVRLHPDSKPYFIADTLHRIAGLTTDQFSDHLILLAIDMLIRNKQWEAFLGSSPTLFFEQKEENVFNKYKNADSFINNINLIFEELKRIQHSYQPQSFLFYIFAFQFDMLDMPVLFNLCKTLDRLKQLEPLCSWSKSGLLLEKPIMDEKKKEKISLDNLSQLDLQLILINIINQYQSKNPDPLIDQLIHFITGQLKKLHGKNMKEEKNVSTKMLNYIALIPDLASCHTENKLEKLIFNIAQISHQHRNESTSQFFLGLKSTDSWKEWKKLVSTLLKSHSPHKVLLEKSLDKNQWKATKPSPTSRK